MASRLAWLVFLASTGCALEHDALVGADTGMHPDRIVMVDASDVRDVVIPGEDADVVASDVPDAIDAIDAVDIVEIVPPDVGPDIVDSGPMDTGPMDTGPMDTGPVDTGPMDTGPVDTGPIDTGPIDVPPTDTGCGGPGQDCCGAAHTCNTASLHCLTYDGVSFCGRCGGAGDVTCPASSGRGPCDTGYSPQMFVGGFQGCVASSTGNGAGQQCSIPASFCASAMPRLECFATDVIPGSPSYCGHCGRRGEPCCVTVGSGFTLSYDCDTGVSCQDTAPMTMNDHHICR